MTGLFGLGRERIEVDCIVDLEQTQEFLHAHAIPEGIALRPGDTVIVHDAPDHVDFGARLTRRCRATVIRGNLFDRWWAETSGLLLLTELYEVGFMPKGSPA